MATIRKDLAGIVCAFRENGETVQLKAGDEVPSGIRIGSHLIQPGEAQASKPEPVVNPAPEPEPAPVVTPTPKRRGRPAKPKVTPDGTS